VDEGEVGYKRVVHVLPEERSGTEDVEGDAIRSVDDVVSICTRKMYAWWLMFRVNSFQESTYTLTRSICSFFGIISSI